MNENALSVSVLLTTYNQPEFLEMSLLAYDRQTYEHFEIVIADDGSGPQTKALIDRMRDTASGVLAAQQMEADFQIEGLDAHAKLPVDLRENVFLIFKEAVTNAAKYSGGSHVTIRLFNSGRSFVMEIADDGRGFSSNKRRSGQGLRNMVMRAERIGGKLTVSEEGGVKIRLTRAPL